MAYVEFKTNPMYVQGPNALLELRRYTYHLGERFLIVTACGPQTQKVKDLIEKSFNSSMVENLQKDNVKFSSAANMAKKYDEQNKKPIYKFVDYEGKQTTFENIDALAQIAQDMNADVVIGIGGGKGMDFARGVHHKTGAKVVLCPTNAASNAAATTLNVIYNEDGSHIVGAGVMDYHPNLVLVDTNIIIGAPVNMLIAGIGDCISAYYETYLSVTETASRYSRYVEYAWHSNEIAKKVFFEHGALAVTAARCGVISPSFESVVAQILHISGPMMATMSMNFSHILDEALIYFEPVRKMIHGFVVGYGVIPQLVYANAPLEEIYEYVDFARSVGLPVNLKELGLEGVTKEEFDKATKVAIGSVTYKLTAAKVKEEDFWRCVILADKIVNEYLASK